MALIEGFLGSRARADGWKVRAVVMVEGMHLRVAVRRSERKRVWDEVDIILVGG